MPACRTRCSSWRKHSPTGRTRGASELGQAAGVGGACGWSLSPGCGLSPLAEFSGPQLSSVLGLAGCRMLLVSGPACSEVMSMGGRHRTAPCPMRAEQMPLCGVHWGAGTRWYPLTAAPGCPRVVEEAPGMLPPWCQHAPRSAPQGPPAHQPAAVPGPVRRGHPLPAGDGVLPAGECHSPISWGCRVLWGGTWHRCAMPSTFWTWGPLGAGGDCGDSGTILQGDLKGYLRSCRGADSMAPDPLTLQRMACEVACGLLHLHRNNYIHR